uniref:Uncharacterized protein n=1 Tax=Cacopsylla melanoneura TaxID=428564 RepID=A0A8D9BAM0_9HEMI
MEPSVHEGASKISGRNDVPVWCSIRWILLRSRLRQVRQKESFGWILGLSISSGSLYSSRSLVRSLLGSEGNAWFLLRQYCLQWVCPLHGNRGWKMVNDCWHFVLISCSIGVYCYLRNCLLHS